MPGCRVSLNICFYYNYNENGAPPFLAGCTKSVFFPYPESSVSDVTKFFPGIVLTGNESA